MKENGLSQVEYTELLLKMQEDNIKAIDKTNQSIEGVANSIQKLNDWNLLHSQRSDEAYRVTTEVHKAVERLTASVDKIVPILRITIFALIALAGAEKVIEFIL